MGGTHCDSAGLPKGVCLIRSCADDCVSVRSEWQRVAAG